MDAVALARDLIRLPSVTPDAQNTMDFLAERLIAIGFDVHQMTFEEEGSAPVPNLYARFGTAKPHLCFAGHTDVVPVGTRDKWSVDPFSGDIRDGALWGRGAADMKSSIAAFVVAAQRIVSSGRLAGSLSFLITGDEEGPAINGTKKVLAWLKDRGETIDYCVVGEPTNPHQLGEMIKVGRRGSLHGTLVVDGVQGHVAYPHHADNPIPRLVRLLSTLEPPLDEGNDRFQPSNLEIVDIHVGNDTHNVIPARAQAHFNVRFNTEFTPESLKAELTRRLDGAGTTYEITWHVSGDAFLTPQCGLAGAVQDAVEARLGRRPDLSTTGGTSDARFIKDMCPVVEFGLVGETMHKIDEHVATEDIEALTDIYEHVIERLAGNRNSTNGDAAV